MKQLVLHANTGVQLEAFIAKPSHAVLITGPTGSGKKTFAQLAAGAVLGIGVDKLDRHPYITIIEPKEGKSIGIDVIRGLDHFLSLKVPGREEFNRVVVLRDGHLMTDEAQNALLKILEEPPDGTLIIVTATHSQALLPTIRSRVQQIQVLKPSPDELKAHFETKSSKSDIEQAYLVSGGLPGLMNAVLNDKAHRLSQATTWARRLLQHTTYERLLCVDELVKQRELTADICFILKQMSHISLQRVSGKETAKWQAILSASYAAHEQLEGNAQPKLALTKLMLSL